MKSILMETTTNSGPISEAAAVPATWVNVLHGFKGSPIASLQTPDGLARAVMAIYDGATIELLLDNDLARFRSWLADLLTALLEHPV